MRTGILLAGTLLFAGCGMLQPAAEAPREVFYTCAYGPGFTATFAGDSVQLGLNGAHARLQATDTAIGSRYASAGDTLVLWTAGDAAMLEMFGAFWSCEARP